MSREIPPTAGLPLRWSDWRPGPDDLAAALGERFGLPEPLLTCSGTAALIVILDTLKQQSARRKVVIPAFTCPLVALAVNYCDLDIALCDLAPDSFDFDADHLAMLLDEQTLAVIPTHLGGRVADVGRVLALARPLGIAVIEDAAQSLGATAGGVSVGLAGDAGFFSLAAGKGLTLYEGDLLVTRDPALRAALRDTARRLLPSSPAQESLRLLQLLGYTALYNPTGLVTAYGAPLRRALAQGRPEDAVGDMPDAGIPLHAVSRRRRRVGCHALARLPAFLDDARARGQQRADALTARTGLPVLRDAQAAEDNGVWPFLMVLMPDEQRRDAALARLWTAGLGVTRLFIHALPGYAGLTSFMPPAAVPHARDFAGRLLTVSNSPWLTDADFDRICAVLAEV